MHEKCQSEGKGEEGNIEGEGTCIRVFDGNGGFMAMTSTSISPCCLQNKEEGEG